MYCPDCGAGVRGGANYCLNCGFDLRGASLLDSPPAIDDAPTDPGARSRSRSGSGPLVVPTLAASPAPGSTRLRTCPACESPNSGHRTLCGRCGADLVSGQRRSTMSATREPAAPDEDSRPVGDPEQAHDRRRSRRTLAIVIAANLVIGLLLGVAWKFGPLRNDTVASAAPTFDVGVYAGNPGPLGVGSADASSSRPSTSERGFGVDLLVDDDVTTAWQNDGSTRPAGIGSLLTLELSEPAWITEVLIANGDQSSDGAFPATARVERLRLLLDDGGAYDVVLLDRTGLQSVRIDPPALTTTVRIEIVLAFPGATETGLALSEVRLRGFAAVGLDRAYAERFSRS